MEESSQLHAPVALPPGKNHGTHRIRIWGAPEPARTFLKREKCLAPTGIRTLDRQNNSIANKNTFEIRLATTLI